MPSPLSLTSQGLLWSLATLLGSYKSCPEFVFQGEEPILQYGSSILKLIT